MMPYYGALIVVDVDGVPTDPWGNSIPPIPENVVELIQLVGLRLMYDPCAVEWVLQAEDLDYRFKQDFRRNYRQWAMKVERALEEIKRHRAHYHGRVIITDQQEWR